ncbi:hypothetical protein ACVW0I_003814 [Bradyrhizobium sp. LM6.11]
MMKRIFLAAIVATFAAGSAFAEDTCESKAVGKDGKGLGRRCQDLVHEEVQGRRLRAQGDERRWQAARRRRQEQLHEEVRSRRVIALRICCCFSVQSPNELRHGRACPGHSRVCFRITEAKNFCRLPRAPTAQTKSSETIATLDRRPGLTDHAVLSEMGRIEMAF